MRQVVYDLPDHGHRGSQYGGYGQPVFAESHVVNNYGNIPVGNSAAVVEGHHDGEVVVAQAYVLGPAVGPPPPIISGFQQPPTMNNNAYR